MAHPWDKRPAETPKAFGAFNDWLQMGPGRMLTECAEEFDYRLQSLKKWSSIHGWAERAAAYDAEELARAAAMHEQRRAEMRQRIMDRGLHCLEIALSVADGRVTDPCVCEGRAAGEPCHCGAWSPIRDRDGNYVGDRPMVAASTRRLAALDIIDRAGITVPKRVEITGADGEAVRLEAQALLGTLSPAAFAALAAAYPDTDPDGDE